MDKYSNQNVSILVVSCDAYQDLWNPFFHCFFKYWPDCPFPVFLGSNFQRYPDNRVEQILIGKDLDYSSNLIAMLDCINQDWVLLWIEDRVLSAPVNTCRVSAYINRAVSEGAAFLKLIASHPYAYTEDSQEVGEVPKGSKYRVCMTVGLWNKAFLRKLLVPGESAWDFERFGSHRSNNFKEKFLSLSFKKRNDPPLVDTHLIIKGRVILDAREFLLKENLMGFLEKRQIQTIWSFVYVKAYLTMRSISSYFRSYIKYLSLLGE